jgi:DNA-directed RNA polymerase subunit L
MDRTLDRIARAKDALMDALRVAESDAPASIVKKLEVLTERCEKLQAEVSEKISRKRR